MEEILNIISQQCNVTKVSPQRSDLLFVTVDKRDVTGLLVFLRDQMQYTHFVNLTAVDWIEEGRFQLTYLLHNYNTKHDIGIRTFIDRDDAVMTSHHHLWEQVATYQRELKEMFGITFPGSPRLDEPFLLEGWDNIPPMRREFDTKQYSEETYFPRPGRKSTDPAAHMREQLYPDDPTNENIEKRSKKT